MQYRSLGRTGIKVSQFCLGTMMFGGRTDKDDSIEIIDHALESGVNFIDTADVYGGNESERIIGPRTLEQVTDNLAATEVRLDSADFERIDRLVPPCSVAVSYYDRATGLDLRSHGHRIVL